MIGSKSQLPVSKLRTLLSKDSVYLVPVESLKYIFIIFGMSSKCEIEMKIDPLTVSKTVNVYF